MKKQKFHPDSGFSLLEVVVAIVIVTFFTTVTMQMIVISAAFKAKAKDYTTASNLIQKDLEDIRRKASEETFPTTSVVPIPTPTIIQLSSVDNLAVDDEVQFQGKPDFYQIASINTLDKTITVPTPGITAQPDSTAIPLINNTLCNRKSTDASNTGLGEKLRLKMQTNLTSTIFPTPSPTPTDLADYADYKAVSGYAPYTLPGTQKKLWLMRKDTNNNTAPYDVVQIKYVVAKTKTNGDPNPNLIVAKLSSEVISNASFQCIK